MPRIVWDFETASAFDLTVGGAAAYSEHPTTEVLCLVWKLVGGNTHGVWTPLLPEYRSLDDLRELIENPDNTFVSHASFEQFIWRNVMEPLGLPAIPLERWEDTQATAAWKSRPLALDKLMKSLGTEKRKDMEGSAITIGLSKPFTKVWWGEQFGGFGTKAAHMRRYPVGTLDRSRATIERVIDYCKIDVDCEEEVLRTLGDLSSAERAVWLLDQKINWRGLRLDMKLVKAMQLIVDKEALVMEQEFGELTGGLGSGQVAKITEWCAAQGVVLENMQKDYLAKLIGVELEEDGYVYGYDSFAEPEEGAESLERPRHLLGAVPDVRRVLEIRLMLGSASIKKLDKMRACVCADGRARGLCQYHAAHSGRWGGRLLQPHNFPRGGIRLDADTAVDAILTGEPAQLVYAVRLDAWNKLQAGGLSDDPLKLADAREYYDKAMAMGAIEMVASCLRYALIPADGHFFLAGDYAGIEMRVVLALAGQYDKCDLLATGADVYLDMACDIYKKPRGALTKANVAERTIGKNTVLGCGFQMGSPKFHARYCPEHSKEFADGVVRAYRTQWAPKVPRLWKAFEETAFATATDGKPRITHGCRFFLDRGYLGIDLPSGRQTLWYPDVRLGISKFDRPCWSYMRYGNPPKEVQMYGGIITENIVQAIARGILVAAMFRLEREGYKIVLTVHDEILCEIPDGDREAHMAKFRAIMEDVTSENCRWISELRVPISVDVWHGPRYKK